jgi:hypothetical protein
MAKKMCEICGENPATVPDREWMGRPINRVCSSCHALRLVGDMKRILELHEKRRQAQLGHNASLEGCGAAGGASLSKRLLGTDDERNCDVE